MRKLAEGYTVTYKRSSGKFLLRELACSCANISILASISYETLFTNILVIHWPYLSYGVAKDTVQRNLIKKIMSQPWPCRFVCYNVLSNLFQVHQSSLQKKQFVDFKHTQSFLTCLRSTGAFIVILECICCYFSYLCFSILRRL